MMIAPWISVSRRRATNREPTPASTSSERDALRRPIVTAVVEEHVTN